MSETAEEYCARLKALDAQYQTSSDSPLHHDNRCDLHKAEHDPECTGCEHNCPWKGNPIGAPFCGVCDDHMEAHGAGY